MSVINYGCKQSEKHHKYSDLLLSAFHICICYLWDCLCRFWDIFQFFKLVIFIVIFHNFLLWFRVVVGQGGFWSWVVRYDHITFFQDGHTALSWIVSLFYWPDYICSVFIYLLKLIFCLVDVQWLISPVVVGKDERAFVFWQRPRRLGPTATGMGASFGLCQRADDNYSGNAVVLLALRC